MTAKIDSDTCRVDGCERPRKRCNNGKGYHSLCGAHDQRRTRHGDVMAHIPVAAPAPKAKSDLCRIEGCGRLRQTATRSTLCAAHGGRLKRHGDAMAHIPIGEQGHWPYSSGVYNTAGYLIVKAPGHPLGTRTGYVAVHRIVLYDKIGPGEHPCHWCGETVSWDIRKGPGALETDHVNATRDDNRPGNLVPSCKSCNIKRGQGIALVGVN